MSTDVKTEPVSETNLLALPLKREQQVASLTTGAIANNVQKELEHLAQIVFKFDSDSMGTPGQGNNATGAGTTNASGRGRSMSSGPSRSRGGSRSQSASGSGSSSINRVPRTDLTLPPPDVFDHPGYRAFQSLVGGPPHAGPSGDPSGSLHSNVASRQFAFPQQLPGMSPLGPPTAESYPWMAYPTYSNQLQQQSSASHRPSHFPLPQYPSSTTPLQPPLGFNSPSTDMTPYSLLLPNLPNALPSTLPSDPFAAQLQQLQALAQSSSSSSSRPAPSPTDSTNRGEGTSTSRSRASVSRAPSARTRTLSVPSGAEGEEPSASADDVLDDKRRRNTAASGEFLVEVLPPE